MGNTQIFICECGAELEISEAAYRQVRCQKCTQKLVIERQKEYRKKRKISRKEQRELDQIKEPTKIWPAGPVHQQAKIIGVTNPDTLTFSENTALQLYFKTSYGTITRLWEEEIKDAANLLSARPEVK